MLKFVEIWFGVLCMSTCADIGVSVRGAHIYIHMCMLCMGIYKQRYVYIYIYTNIYIYIYIYVHRNKYVYIYLIIYTHTYLYINGQ